MYSPVANIHVLSELKSYGILPNYLLLLAHEVVANPVAWQSLLQDFYGTVIVDNSLIELGHACDPAMLIEAAKITQPNFIVLPDKLLDVSATLAGSEEAALTWGQQTDSQVGFLMVLQGNNTDEINICAQQFKNIKSNRPLMFGVPRILTNSGLMRSNVVKRLDIHRVPIHLLGMSNIFGDDMLSFRESNFVVGIDSATPLRAGWEKVFYTMAGCPAPKVNRELYFSDCFNTNHWMRYNIAFVNGVVGGMKNARGY